jgi:hypothetical protein
MNLKTIRLFAIAALWLLHQTLSAQCQYRLEMKDSFGDGWNGGTLLITVGVVPTSYTLNNITDDGSDSTVYFTVADGQPLNVLWTPGAFNPEVSFQIYDYEDNLIYSASAPATGILFSGVAVCPSCLKPSGLVLENVWDTRARFRWTPGANAPSSAVWAVIYGPAGFDPASGTGDTAITFLPKITLTGLQKKTKYDAYILQDCGNDDYSNLAGPISFETYWTNDVGISGVLTPQNSCDLDVETVTVLMRNYGAAPQSLIPFRFSVNGVDAGVAQPNDGFFTGVLGKDSSKVIEFETTFDFSDPGEYRIEVYTQMNGDEDTANDTFVYYVVNRLQAPYAQNFENWNGGWFADSAGIASSWEFGQPSATIIKAAAEGRNAWVTNLNGLYNAGERSYLNSPCFDFSTLTEDPVIEFSINYNTESSYDGGFLEMSLDGGTNWERVGAIGEGLNWYNFNNVFTSLGQVWSGNSNGWQKARRRLDGVAGAGEVRLRFGFGADGSAQFEGMGVDDIRIYVPLTRDLVGLSVTTTGENNQCGLANDSIRFTIANFGAVDQGAFKVGYSINGGAPVEETIGVVLSPDDLLAYTFNVPFDSRDNDFNIRCWTNLTGEQNRLNDTVKYFVSHLPRPLPFVEDFEASTLPSGWTSNGLVTNLHNNTSQVLAFNLYSSSSSFNHVSPRFGPVTAGDSLFFDYRITDFAGNGTIPTVLPPGSKVDVQISTDCGATFQTIYVINLLSHIPSVNMRTIKLGLSAYDGKSIRIRFRGAWALSGDFWVDIDNINLRTCPDNLGLTATTTTTAPGQSTGTATVSVGAGNSPYTYLWSNGNTSATATNLPGGEATVSVTDARGCTDVLTVFIGTTSAGEIEGLNEFSFRPNPTAGFAWLTLGFERPVDLRVQVLSMLGQVVWENNYSYTTRLLEEIDLSRYPDGLYLLQITSEGRNKTVKLVKSTR